LTKPFQTLLERLSREPDDSLNICYQSAKQGFKTKATKVRHADSVVEALNDLECNVWYEINPSVASGRSKAEDVARLAAVWIDIDFKESGIQSHDNAYELIDLLSDLIGVGPSAVVHSGNGLQPYWAIDPEEDYTQELGNSLLLRWGAFCRWVAASQGGQLDSVFDLARIFRAPGSFNMKDETNPINVIVDFPEDWRPVSYEELNDVLIAHGFASVTTGLEDFELVSASSEWKYVAHDCGFAQTMFSAVRPGVKAPKSRHGWLLQQLVRLNAAHRNGCLTEDSAKLIIAQMSERFDEFLSIQPSRKRNPGELQGANRWAVARVESFDEKRLKEELRNHEHKDLLSSDPSMVLLESPVNYEVTEDELLTIYMSSFGAYGRTDAANARRLIHFMKGDFRFVPELGWLRWEGQRYVPDKEKAIWQTAIDAAHFALRAGAAGEQLKWAEASANKERLQNAAVIAATDPEVLCQAFELDSDVNSLCTPSGVVNLRTGELRPAKKGSDLNTRQTTVPMGDVPTPLWNTFLKEVIEDADRILYLQELLGASLFGDSRFHVLPVLVGTGANGKSTLLDVVAKILGDYSATMPENFLLETGTSAHPTEIARLRGVRFAIASETRPDGRFNEARVKMLTGGDMLSARFMNQNFFDFKPTHTLFLAVNHLPEVKSGGDGFWRRLRKIDFRKTVPPEKRKENLAELMVEQEGAGILKWIVEGAVRITEQGMSEPDSVKLSTQEYRHEEDHLAKFIDEKIIVSDKSSVTKTSVFNSYRDWCSENGEKPVPQNNFNRELKSRLGVTESTSVGFKMFVGIDLLKIDSYNNEMTVRNMVDSLEDLAIDGDDRDRYWE
jgi:P4 family phage/plasmid primase-like protien